MRDAVDVLAAAFADDPGFRHVLPEEATRDRRLRAVWAAATRHCRRVGGVEQVGEDGGAVAVWSEDHTMQIGPVAAMMSGSLTMPMRISLPSFRRLARMEQEGDDLVRDTVARPFAYLMGLAVHPSRQGRGLARAAIDAVVREAAERGHQRLALRTENVANVPLYEHLGFSVTGRLPASATSTGLEVTAMVRPIA